MDKTLVGKGCGRERQDGLISDKDFFFVMERLSIRMREEGGLAEVDL